MKVGDYVRTNKGTIDKLTEENIIDYKISLLYEGEKLINWSENIIDLICVGDLMFIDISPDDCGGIVVPRIAETLDEGKKYHDKLKSGEYVLKGILTKEQIEQMEYKINE